MILVIASLWLCHLPANTSKELTSECGKAMRLSEDRGCAAQLCSGAEMLTPLCVISPTHVSMCMWLAFSIDLEDKLQLVDCIINSVYVKSLHTGQYIIREPNASAFFFFFLISLHLHHMGLQGLFYLNAGQIDLQKNYTQTLCFPNQFFLLLNVHAFTNI